MNHLVKKLLSFANLSNQEIRILDRLSRQRLRAYAPNRDVIRDGEELQFAHILCEGWALRSKRLADGGIQILDIMLAGDWCGFDPNINPVADHGIETITSCQFARITAEEVREMLSSEALQRAVSNSQLASHGIQMNWTVNNGRRNALDGLAHLISELHFRMKRCGLTDGLEFAFPLNQTVIADCLGLTPVHTNRVLMDLRKRRILEVENRRMRILDLPELHRIAGFDPDYMHGPSSASH